MKRKAAFVEEEDPETGEAVLGTEISASIFLSPEQSRERRKVWRRSDSDFASDSKSTHLGTVLNVIEELNGQAALLTIIAGEHEDNAEVWKDCKNAGTKFRLITLKDSVINGETKTYAIREILLSKEGGDLDRENSDIIIGQRKFMANGRIRLEAHRLIFRGRLDVDRPYIFPKLGDEIPGVGFPDLHCTFRAIRDWGVVEKRAEFAGYDRNITVEVSASDVKNGKMITFDIERDEFVPPAAKPTVGMVISCTDFKPLFNRMNASLSVEKEAQSTLESKKMRLGDRWGHAAEPSMSIGLKLIGMGPEIESRAMRADLNVNFVLKL